MASAIKSLTFVARWPNIPLWGVVYLWAAQGRFRAEYVNASERKSGDNWTYDFQIFSDDLPAGLTLDMIVSGNIIAPFVEAYAPCEPVQTRCFASIPLLGEDEEYDLAVIVGPDDCGNWCLKRTPAPDQYEHGGTWNDDPGQPDPP